MKIKCALASLAIGISALAPVAAQDQNFPGRKALIVNTCPFVELSDFGYKNYYADRATRFAQDLKWKNVGSQALTAFEVVILKYDPFDRRLIGTRWTVTEKTAPTGARFSQANPVGTEQGATATRRSLPPSLTCVRRGWRTAPFGPPTTINSCGN